MRGKERRNYITQYENLFSQSFGTRQLFPPSHNLLAPFFSFLSLRSFCVLDNGDLEWCFSPQRWNPLKAPLISHDGNSATMSHKNRSWRRVKNLIGNMIRLWAATLSALIYFYLIRIDFSLWHPPQCNTANFNEFNYMKNKSTLCNAIVLSV